MLMELRLFGFYLPFVKIAGWIIIFLISLALLRSLFFILKKQHSVLLLFFTLKIFSSFF